MTMTKKELALAEINEFMSGDKTITDEYMREDYKQHNLAYATGKAGFDDAVDFLQTTPEKTIVENIRAYEDGDYVFMQTHYNMAGAGDVVTFDVIRFQDGKIAEHWDNEAALTPSNPSGHTQIDGPVESTDLDKTEANKELVSNFVREVLRGENPAAITNYFNNDNYIQHNSGIADGLSGLGVAMKAMADAGQEMIYDDTHFVLGEGNFVLAASEGKFNGKHVAFYDLFRVDNDKIAEHWDTIQEIPSKKDWTNPNGKF